MHISAIYMNLAEGKTAFQQTTLSTWNASLAVDGGLSTNALDGSCSHTTDANIDPWWGVDLGGSYPIAVVSILNAQKLEDYIIGHTGRSHIFY